MRPLIHTAIASALLASAAAADGDTGAKGAIVELEPAPQVAQPTRHVRADTYRAGKIGHRNTRGTQVRGIVAQYTCPPNFNGMFRGTLYCMNGKTLP